MRDRNGKKGRRGVRGARPEAARPATLEIRRLGAQAAARVQLRADTAREPGAEPGRRWAGRDGQEVRVLCFHCNYN